MTTLDDLGGVLGHAFGHFLLGSHNFTVTARGLWHRMDRISWSLELFSKTASRRGA